LFAEYFVCLWLVWLFYQIKLSLLVWYSAIKATVCVVMCETLLTDI